MTRPFRLVAAALLCLCSAACGHGTALRAESRAMSEEARLLALEHDMMSAIRNRDRAGLERLLHAGFELHTPGHPPVARAAFLDAVLSIPGTVLSVESEGVEARIYGDVGIILGRQRARVRLDDGITVTDVQAFTDIARLHEGRWWLVLAHSAPMVPVTE